MVLSTPARLSKTPPAMTPRAVYKTEKICETKFRKISWALLLIEWLLPSIPVQWARPHRKRSTGRRGACRRQLARTAGRHGVLLPHGRGEGRTHHPPPAPCGRSIRFLWTGMSFIRLPVSGTARSICSGCRRGRRRCVSGLRSPAVVQRVPSCNPRCILAAGAASSG